MNMGSALGVVKGTVGTVLRESTTHLGLSVSPKLKLNLYGSSRRLSTVSVLPHRVSDMAETRHTLGISVPKASYSSAIGKKTSENRGRLRVDALGGAVRGVVRAIKDSSLCFINVQRRFYEERAAGKRVKIAPVEPRHLFSTDHSELEVLESLRSVLKSEKWDKSYRKFLSFYSDSYNTTSPDKWTGENEFESMASHMMPLLHLMGVKVGLSKYIEPRLIGDDYRDCRRHAWLTLKEVAGKPLKEPIVIDPTIRQFVERIPDRVSAGSCFIGTETEYFELLRPELPRIKESSFNDSHDRVLDFYRSAKSEDGVVLSKIPLFGWNRTSVNVQEGLGVLRDVEACPWNLYVDPIQVDRVAVLASVEQVKLDVG